MGEYISREAVLVVLDWDCASRDALDAIKAIPAADVVEVRHGRWVNGRCSECGEHAPYWALATTYHLSKYCPSCGAKMDGGQDDV